MICAAASWRLGEEDSKAWSIVESKFPYERNFQIGDSSGSSSPLPHAVLNVLQAAKYSAKLVSMRFVDQAGLLLEQSMVYYNCKEKSSQQVLVSWVHPASRLGVKFRCATVYLLQVCIVVALHEI